MRFSRSRAGGSLVVGSSISSPPPRAHHADEPRPRCPGLFDRPGHEPVGAPIAMFDHHSGNQLCASIDDALACSSDADCGSVSREVRDPPAEVRTHRRARSPAVEDRLPEQGRHGRLTTFCGDCADRSHLIGRESEPNGTRTPAARPILRRKRSARCGTGGRAESRRRASPRTAPGRDALNAHPRERSGPGADQSLGRRSGRTGPMRSAPIRSACCSP